MVTPDTKKFMKVVLQCHKHNLLLSLCLGLLHNILPFPWWRRSGVVCMMTSQITLTKHIYLKVITICQKRQKKPLQIFFKNIWVITKYFHHLWIEAFNLTFCENNLKPVRTHWKTMVGQSNMIEMKSCSYLNVYWIFTLCKCFHCIQNWSVT